MGEENRNRNRNWNGGSRRLLKRRAKKLGFILGTMIAEHIENDGAGDKA